MQIEDGGLIGCRHFYFILGIELIRIRQLRIDSVRCKAKYSGVLFGIRRCHNMYRNIIAGNRLGNFRLQQWIFFFHTNGWLSQRRKNTENRAYGKDTYRYEQIFPFFMVVSDFPPVLINLFSQG